MIQPVRIDLRECLAGLRGRSVHVAHLSAEEDIRRGLEEAGFETITLMGSNIRNEATFFKETARALDFPDGDGQNWDAFAACLERSLERGAHRLAIIWFDFDRCLDADVQTFLEGVLALDRISQNPGNAGRQVEVFLLGAGPGFAETF